MRMTARTNEGGKQEEKGGKQGGREGWSNATYLLIHPEDEEESEAIHCSHDEGGEHKDLPPVGVHKTQTIH